MKNKFSRLTLIFAILGLLIASWFLVHILAVLGIFLAVAYPLWWLFAPEKTICFLCRAEKEGAKCPFCHREIKKNEGVSPRSLSSAILNGVLILVFSTISFGVVFGESQLLFKLGFPPTPKTASFVIPPKGQYRLGEIFPMKIEINNIKNPINALQADIGFEPQKLEVVDISTNDSFANIFIQKEINNEGGWARLTGGLPNPGFFANSGTFGTVFFKGKAPGLVKIEFLPSSLVLANDGRGTNILKDLPSASYLILPEKISTEEEEQQKKLISQTSVLGESTNSAQMKFYDEGSVLGTTVGKEIQEQKKFSISKILLTGLEKIDRFSLGLLEKLLSIFRKTP